MTDVTMDTAEEAAQASNEEYLTTKAFIRTFDANPERARLKTTNPSPLVPENKPSDKCPLTEDAVNLYLAQWDCTVDPGGDLAQTSLYSYDFRVPSNGNFTTENVTMYVNRLQDVVDLCVTHLSSLTNLWDAVFRMWITHDTWAGYGKPQPITPIELVIEVCKQAMNCIGRLKTPDFKINSAFDVLLKCNIRSILEAVDLFNIRTSILRDIQRYISSPSEEWKLSSANKDIGTYVLISPEDMLENDLVRMVDGKLETEPGLQTADNNWGIYYEEAETDVRELLKNLQFIHGNQKSNNLLKRSAPSPLGTLCEWTYEHLVFLDKNPKERTLWAKEADVSRYQAMLRNVGSTTTDRVSAFQKLLQLSFRPANVQLLCELLNTGNLFMMHDGLGWLYKTWIMRYTIERNEMDLDEGAEVDGIVTKAFGFEPGATLKYIIDTYYRIENQKRNRWYKVESFVNDLFEATNGSQVDPIMDRFIYDWVSFLSLTLKSELKTTAVQYNVLSVESWFGALQKSSVERLRTVMKRSNRKIPDNVERLLDTSRGTRFQMMSKMV